MDIFGLLDRVTLFAEQQRVDQVIYLSAGYFEILASQAKSDDAYKFFHRNYEFRRVAAPEEGVCFLSRSYILSAVFLPIEDHESVQNSVNGLINGKAYMMPYSRMIFTDGSMKRIDKDGELIDLN